MTKVHFAQQKFLTILPASTMIFSACFKAVNLYILRAQPALDARSYFFALKKRFEMAESAYTFERPVISMQLTQCELLRPYTFQFARRKRMVSTAILAKYQPYKIKAILIVLLMASFSLAQNGSLTEHTVEHDGLSRSYLLYVPASYDGTTEWPLVISYHGNGVDLVNYMSGTAMSKEADVAQYIVAYPQGLEICTLRGCTPGWNLLGRFSDNDDMGFSLALINQIKANYRIDPSRVHLAGWSMGAGLAYDVACTHSDQIASFAAVSQQMAIPQFSACSPDRAMSFLQIHGTADPTISFDGSAGFFGPAPETAAFWGALNNCSPDPTSIEIEDEVTEDNSTVTLFEYKGCDSESEVLFYQVNDGGHAWPGPGVLDTRVDLGNWNRDINASFEILTFFGRNPLPQSGTAVEKSTWGTVKSDF